MVSITRVLNLLSVLFANYYEKPIVYKNHYNISFLDSYNEARSKVKKAEMNSDVNTDIDDKTQRKVRAR